MALIDSKLSCDIGLSNRSRKLKNLFYLGTRQSSVPMIFSSWASVFLSAIFVVICLGSQRQMTWIHTRRVIARMHDHHSFRYGSSGALIGISMCSHLNFSGKRKNSISKLVVASCPFPTSRWHDPITLLKHIFRTDEFVFLKFSLRMSLRVMLTTKVSSNRWIAANGAGDFCYGPIGHRLQYMPLL